MNNVTKIDSEIWFTFEQEGIHCYPDAATNELLKSGNYDDVSFLAYPHRHLFKFKVCIEVFHDDRDIEFIQAKRYCQNLFKENVININHKSCEMLADDLFTHLEKKYKKRNIKISVSEDGENGCNKSYFVLKKELFNG